MTAVCARCQGTFETVRQGRQFCPRCGQELWLPGPDEAAGGFVAPAFAQPATPPAMAAPGPAVRPSFLGWFRAWCWTMALLDLGGVAFGVAGGMGAFVNGRPRSDDVAVGVILVCFGLALFAAHVAVPLLPRSRTAWAASLALLGVSVMVCCWPLALVFLIQFLKPETRRWYESA